MEILVLTGSPHKHGSSNLLAKHFIRGARKTGHEVSVFDAAHTNQHPCLGCDACGMSGSCCQKDDMATIKNAILSSDMVVFATPLYYFGMSAQLKTVIDHFYSFNGRLTSRRLKSALIAAAWNNDGWTMTDLTNHYQTLCCYLNFSDQGMILGTGCGTVAITERTGYPQKAYELGKSL